MAIGDYLDLVLVARDVQKDAAGMAHTFTVNVFDSPVGQGQQDERVSVPDGLTAELARLEGRLLDQDADRQIEVGRQLADLLFPSHARELLRASLARLRDGEGLRVRLRLADELADFPWEYVYIADARGERTSSGFLALDRRISLVRHEAVALPADWFDGPGSRRVVIAMASPEPYETWPQLPGLPAEQAAIKAVFDRIPGIRAVYLPDYSPNSDAIPGATWRGLMAALTQERTDVFHFAGHGQFVSSGPALGVAGEGSIILADERNQAFPLPGERLAELLRGTGVRLVMLGACQTGRRDNRNVWSSVAAALLKAGIPAVVAMQFAIGDLLAVAFSEAFYRALVAGQSVDQAVALGRQAIRLKALEGSRDAIDWGVPVLYLRAQHAGPVSAAAAAGAAPGHPSALPEERAFLEAELAQHKRNLARLRQQKAVYAEGEAPLRLLNQIDAEEQAIQDVASRLA